MWDEDVKAIWLGELAILLALDFSLEIPHYLLAIYFVFVIATKLYCFDGPVAPQLLP